MSNPRPTSQVKVDDAGAAMRKAAELGRRVMAVPKGAANVVQGTKKRTKRT